MGYPVHFDTVRSHTKLETDEQKEARKKRLEEAKRREQQWLAESSIVVGVPGRCVIINRGEKTLWVDKKLVEMWNNDPDSILYRYNDIEILSGTAGYVLKTKDGQTHTQVTLVS
jgi:hypothetical protein